MKGLTILMVVALLGLTGCDLLGFGQGDKPDGNRSAATNTSNASASADGKPTNGAAPADAGVTTSRSLTGLLGGDAGGKDPVAVPAASGATVDRAALIGDWADDDACKSLISLGPDGTFRSADGGQGTWRLSGDVLTLAGPGGSYAVRIQSIDSGLLTVVNPDGSIGRSRRC